MQYTMYLLTSLSQLRLQLTPEGQSSLVMLRKMLEKCSICIWSPNTAATAEVPSSLSFTNTGVVTVTTVSDHVWLVPAMSGEQNGSLSIVVLVKHLALTNQNTWNYKKGLKLKMLYIVKKHTLQWYSKLCRSHTWRLYVINDVEDQIMWTELTVWAVL